jgi:hypothetical protein
MPVTCLPFSAHGDGDNTQNTQNTDRIRRRSPRAAGPPPFPVQKPAPSAITDKMSKPVIHYFPIRGRAGELSGSLRARGAAALTPLSADQPPMARRCPRPCAPIANRRSRVPFVRPLTPRAPHHAPAEPAKLAYALKGVEFEVADVDYQQMKTDLDAYPFGQCPRCAACPGRPMRPAEAAEAPFLAQHSLTPGAGAARSRARCPRVQAGGRGRRCQPEQHDPQVRRRLHAAFAADCRARCCPPAAGSARNAPQRAPRQPGRLSCAPCSAPASAPGTSRASWICTVLAPPRPP